MNLLKQIENEQVAKLTAGKEIPDFQPGDTVHGQREDRRRRAQPRAGL